MVIYCFFNLFTMPTKIMALIHPSHMAAQPGEESSNLVREFHFLNINFAFVTDQRGRRLIVSG